MSQSASISRDDSLDKYYNYSIRRVDAAQERIMFRHHNHSAGPDHCSCLVRFPNT